MTAWSFGSRADATRSSSRRIGGWLPKRSSPMTATCRRRRTARNGAIWLLTGPNMGGKSTFLRQNALIAVLAQAGSFVPASRAHIGVVDRLFSRVGASDDLARGRSTFMVEMVETAAILNQAGERALVILDEIGRGTATFDGLSIAWAAVEYLHEKNRCRAIFATHFHEMTSLAGKLPRLHNVTMRVKEWEGDVIFLHEVAKGAADRSYGVQVARLAGLPDAVVQRAKDVLHQLESGENSGKANRLVDDLPLFSAAVRREPPKAAKADALGEAVAGAEPRRDDTARGAGRALSPEGTWRRNRRPRDQASPEPCGTVSPQPSRRAILNGAPSRLLTSFAATLPSSLHSFRRTVPLADCGGARTRAAGLPPGVLEAAMKMYFSSSHGTSAFLASRCRRERATRRAKWHQSGAASGQSA